MLSCEEIDKFRWVLLALALHNDIIIILNRNSAAEVFVSMCVRVSAYFTASFMPNLLIHITNHF